MEIFGALFVFTAYLSARRLVKHARLACRDMLIEVQAEVERIDSTYDELRKDHNAHISNLAGRIENFGAQITQVTGRITKLEQTPQVKAKTAARSAIEELVKGR